MKVTFSSPQILGNRKYASGEQEVPASLMYNRQFKNLVSQGVIKMPPKDAGAQKIQLSRDAKAFQKAQAARKAAQAAKKAASLTSPPKAAAEAPQAPSKGAIKPGKATTVSVTPAKGK